MGTKEPEKIATSAWRWSQEVHPKCWYTSIKNTTSHTTKNVIWIFTAVIT